MRCAVVVPAFEAAATVGDVVQALASSFEETESIFVVDDGSTDATAELAKAAGATVVRHPRNLGKGAALRTGLTLAAERGFEAAVTVDADGQHPAAEALRLARSPADPRALVLGIRDLERAGAPRKNQTSNRISNGFLSWFSGVRLADTQCGLRRYPLPVALALGGVDNGYAYEAEILLRAIAAHVPLVELPIDVYYPPEAERVTHFDSVRDPARIVRRVVHVLWLTRGMRTSAPMSQRAWASADAP